MNKQNKMLNKDYERVDIRTAKADTLNVNIVQLLYENFRYRF